MSQTLGLSEQEHGLLVPPHPRINGVWVTPEQYLMVDSITGRKKPLFVVGAGHSDLVEKEELEDIILEYRDIFAEECDQKQPRMPMPRQQQHDLGKTLKEIEASREHRKESLHSRWW